MEEIDRFGWVDESLFGEAACVTLVEGMDLAAVAEAFGGSLDDAATKDFDDDDYDPESETAWVALRQVGDWVLALEDNGYQGRRPEVLRRLTGGRAVSCFWNVNAVTEFSYVEGGGTVVASFEPGFGSPPDVLEPWTAGLLPKGGDDDVPGTQLMLALAARVTGVVVTPEMLSGRMPTVYLLPWPDDVRDVVFPRFEPLTHDEPVLAYALLRADEAALRRAARVAVEQAAIVAGIEGDAEIMAVVDGFASPGDFLVLDQLARDLEPQNLWQRFRAVEAARACSSPNALAAAYQAITAASYALRLTEGSGQEVLRGRLFEALGSPPPPSGSGGLLSAEWLDEHWLGWAACVTFLRGPGEFDLAVGEPVTGPVTLTTEPMAWTRTFGQWSVVVEPGSPARRTDQLLERISAGGGEAVLAQWSARGNVEFWHAVDGTIRTRFNGYAPEQVWGAEPHALDALRAGLPIPRPGVDGGGQGVGLLALAARLTGVELTAASLDEQWVGRKLSYVRPRVWTMSSSSAPIILVPGFWLGAWAWDEVAGALRADGHDVTALTLPGLESADTDRSAITLKDHVDAIVAAVDAAATAAGRPVVLAVHSGAGASGYAATDRVPDRIATMVYVDSGPAIGALEPDFQEVDKPLAPTWEELGENLEGISEEQLETFRRRAVPEPGGAIRDAVELTDERRRDIPTVAICTAFTSEEYKSAIEEGYAWLAGFKELSNLTWVDLPTSHWPMWSRPKELADLLSDIARRA